MWRVLSNNPRSSELNCALSFSTYLAQLANSSQGTNCTSTITQLNAILSARTDRTASATRFEVTLPFILQQAAWLYERQLAQVRAQMRRMSKPDIGDSARPQASARPSSSHQPKHARPEATQVSVSPSAKDAAPTTRASRSPPVRRLSRQQARLSQEEKSISPKQQRAYPPIPRIVLMPAHERQQHKSPARPPRLQSPLPTVPLHLKLKPFRLIATHLPRYPTQPDHRNDPSRHHHPPHLRPPPKQTTPRPQDEA